jgi:hypothetical protein
MDVHELLAARFEANRARLRAGRLFEVLCFRLKDARIVEIDLLADPQRLSRLDLAVLDD